MAVVTPTQVSFNGGEISPRLQQRWDQSIRAIAVKKMDGWLPLLQGPAEACPGTLFVAQGKGPFRPIPYEFNTTQGYQIEAGAGYARFYTNDVRIETSPGTAYEISTPWTLDQVRALYYHQSLDVMYCAVRGVPLQRLFRTSADTFAIEPYVLENGPFEARNSDKGITVEASDVTGSVTIEATAAIFAAGDVGGLMEIEGGVFDTIPSWESGMVSTVGSLCQSNGNVYQHVAGGQTRTGQNAPSHIEGIVQDGIAGKDTADKGPYGVRWQYLYNRWGLVQITVYDGPTQVQATVLKRLPTTAPCWRWRFGAFSPRRGYPEVVGIWQERLVVAKDRTLHLSVSGALNDFSLRNEFGDATRDMAFSVDLDDASAIQWILGDTALVAGTATKEHVIVQASQAQGAGPGNTDTGNPRTRGSAKVRPVLIDSRAVFVQRARAKLLQFAYDANQLLQAESSNLTRFTDHIGSVGMNELAWCAEPERLLWTRLDDGRLGVCAYDPDEQLLAWATRTLGGGMTARGISAITDPDGRYPQLWIAAQSGSEYWMLRMAPVRATGDAREQVMLDAATRRTGAPGSIASAAHLANRTVDICADGRPIMGVVLDSAGNYTMDFAASDVIVGLRFPAELTYLSPSSGSENGPAYGKKKRASRIDLGLINSDTLEVECQGATERVNLLKRDTALDTKNPLATGRHQAEPRGDVTDDIEITVRRLYPRPSTLTVIMPHFESAQA